MGESLITVKQPLRDHMREKHGEKEPHAFTDDHLIQVHRDQHQRQEYRDHSHPAESAGVFYGHGPSPFPD